MRKKTKFLVYFELNKEDDTARRFTKHYFQNNGQKQSQRRVQGGDKIITRMYVESPTHTELFHLLLVLLHVVGPKSFVNIRKYNLIQGVALIDACQAHGLASNDSEWLECLDNAKEFHSPKQMCGMFAIICALNVSANAFLVWDDFKEHMSEDVLRKYNQQNSYNRALLEIEGILLAHNVKCEAIGLLSARHIVNEDESEFFDSVEEQFLFQEMYQQAKMEQKT